jgi:hypothetical protein
MVQPDAMIGALDRWTAEGCLRGRGDLDKHKTRIDNLLQSAMHTADFQNDPPPIHS